MATELSELHLYLNKNLKNFNRLWNCRLPVIVLVGVQPSTPIAGFFKCLIVFLLSKKSVKNLGKFIFLWRLKCVDAIQYYL